MYKFRRATEEEISALEEKGVKIYSADCTDENFAIFLGRLITAFGEPHYTNDNYKDIHYWITAEDGQNKICLGICYVTSSVFVGVQNKICFAVYNGSDYMSVIDELITLVESSKPSNYECGEVMMIFR